MRFRKSITYHFLLWVLLIPNAKTYAQVIDKSYILSPNERNNAIKINLLSPLYSTINLSYQYAISRTSSIQLTASYMDFDSYGATFNPVDSLHGGSNEVESQRTQGFTIMPEYRFVSSGRGVLGLYVAPFIRYAYYEYSQVALMDTSFYNSQLGYVVNATYRKPNFYAYHTVAIGCTFGKQIVFKNKVCIDFFGGPVYSILVSSNKDIKYPADVVIGPFIPNAYIKGLGIRAGIAIGIIY